MASWMLLAKAKGRSASQQYKKLSFSRYPVANCHTWHQVAAWLVLTTTNTAARQQLDINANDY
jgi:hypothetical protein